MAITIICQTLIPVRRDGQQAVIGNISSTGGGSGFGGGGTTYTGGINILVSGTTISVVNAPVFSGTVKSPIFSGTTCITAPIICATTCSITPTSCASTSVLSPLVCGTTKVCTPFLAATTCACSPIVNATTCSTTPIACATTSVLSPLVCATTKVCTPFLAATTCACSPIVNGTNYILTPILSATTGIFVCGTSNSAILNYGGVSKSNYASQTTGYRVSTNGEADFRYIYADEAHFKSFIADLEQALSGGQIITKSVAKVAVDFTLPTSGNTGTLVVEEFAGFTGAVFVNGDVIRLRQFSRANNTTLNVSDAWGTVTYVSRDATANPTTQSYTFTRSNAPNMGAGSGVVKTGTLALDYGTAGQGLIETTTVDGINGANSPYTQILTWSGHPATGLVLKMRSGNLSGVTDSLFGGALSGYGLYANNVYLTGCVVLPSAGITNDGSSASCVRFYAGCDYAHRTTAPFMVTQNGSLTATGIVELGTAPVCYGTYSGGLALKGADIYENGYNGQSYIFLNRNGYNGGTTQYRGLVIGNGIGGEYMDFHRETSINKDCISIGNSGSDTCTDFRIHGSLMVHGSSAFYNTLTADNTITATNFILSSDKRQKMNIQSLSISAVNIDYKQFNLCNEKEQLRFGVIAQDLQKTNPELVRVDSEGMLSVAYIDLFIKEISALKCEVKDLKRDINYYKNYNC